MKILKFFVILLSSLLLTSCFTGIESTKKIKLSREDQRRLEPTAEDLLLSDIKATGHDTWPQGKVFYVVDDRASLLFDAKKISSGKNTLQKGDTLIYLGSSLLTAPDGVNYPYIEFMRDGDIFGFAGRHNSKRGSVVMSDELPGIVDCEMLEKVKDVLVGRTVWTRSSLWMDMAGRRFAGLRFLPVSIFNIEPGDMVFPIRVDFIDDKGDMYYYTMNFGNSGKDSHSFSTLFSLDNPRKKYPAISDKVWENIMAGRVEIGMTKEECKLAKGNPSDVNTGHSYSKDLLLWSYPDATVLYFEDGILTGINNFENK